MHIKVMNIWASVEHVELRRNRSGLFISGFTVMLEQLVPEMS